MNFVFTPRMSEKSYGQSTAINTYAFNVPLSANKIEIKQAIEKSYDVKVETVNIVKQDGKVKHSYKKGGRKITGKKSDFKKAYVKLAQGQTIPVFASLDKAEDK